MITFLSLKSSALSILHNKWLVLIISLVFFIGARSSSQMPVASLQNDISIHFDPNGIQLTRRQQNSEEDEASTGCGIFNVTDDFAKTDCSPGSMYIIRCMQCICPYVGRITPFCRPLDPNVYCEQAYPGYNYMSMGRRHKLNGKGVNSTDSDKSLMISHLHTKYDCNMTGRIMDKCFLCECTEGVLIEEHCFRKDSKDCETALPSFLKL